MRAFLEVIFLAALAGQSSAAEPFELKDGDRVVLIGNTLIEREQRYGYWEAALTARWPDRNITFRNLGWSGDTVFGDARAGFDTPAKGFQRLIEHTLALKPTVILVGYGGVEAFEGAAGLPRFEKGLEKLLDALAPAKARIVLLSPLPMQYLGRPGNDPAAVNRNLAVYRDAIRAIAAKRGYHYVDLYDTPPGAEPPGPFTDNGLHLSEQGYVWKASQLINGLDSRPGPALPTREQFERLRRAIIAKNQEYFHRWRPQNETYLFGFRKHEQGKNAAEVLLFEPIVEKYEKEIARIRKALHVEKLK